MYQEHFGLHGDPFALGPSLRFLYRSRAHAETMAHLSYGLEQGEDLILIVGVIGTGKTLALHHLQSKVSRLFRQVLVNVTSVDYTAFLKLVLHELGQTWPPEADRADVLCLLKEQALAVHAEGQKILLVVDEAQNLDAETLEGVRLLTNLGQPDKQLFQIVLVGQPSLVESIEAPRLAQLRQRIRVHYRLEPLTAKETGEYIAHRMTVAGRSDPVFTAGAIARIQELSGGIPRLVNHLAGNALLSAFVDNARRIDVRHVAAEGMPEPPPPVDGPAAPDSEPARSAPSVQRPSEPAAPLRKSRRRVWVWGGVSLASLVLVVLGAIYLFERYPAVERPPVLVERLPLSGDDRDPVPPEESEELLPQPADAADAALAQAAPSAPGVAAVEPPAPPADGSDAPSEVLSRPASDTGTPATSLLAAGHWLHVASFQDAERAERYHSQLAAAGSPVVIREVSLDREGGRELWLRLMVGPFASMASADSAATILQERRLITFHRVMAY